MKSLRILLGFLFGLLIIGAVAAAYFRGLWIPNYPAEKNFPIRGIDVSRHQGTIAWSNVPRAQVHFVYIKATEGGDYRDALFPENWQACRAAGLPRGAYHFFTLKTPGQQQAANFIAAVPKEPDSLPPAIDLEFWGNSSVRPAVPDFQRELHQFISIIRAHYGREPVLYTADDFKDSYLRDFPIPRLWIRSVVTKPRLPKGQDWLFWQFSEHASIPGIQGLVDQNVFKGDETVFRALLSEGN